jgi:surfeit locus 1 family protein
MWRIALRPRWIAALFFALFVAGVFAALGQWQIDRSIIQATVIERDTETVVPLASVETPQSTATSQASGHMVSIECAFVPRDDLVMTNRQSADREGSWLVRHCVTPEGDSVAVAAGWIGEGVILEDVEPGTGTVVGRYVPTESPQQSDFQAGAREAVAVAELLNLWAEPGPVYGGYVVLESAPEPLDTIVALPPVIDRDLNILNLFYAAQWAIFALFALYFWYRLVKDVWERELEEAAAASPKLVTLPLIPLREPMCRTAFRGRSSGIALLRTSPAFY